MDFKAARTMLQGLIDEAGERPTLAVPVEALKEILSGFDNDEQVLIMHNTAVSLLLKLGGRAELNAKDTLEIHRRYTMQFGKAAEGVMVLQAVEKVQQN